MSDRKLQVQG